MSDLNVTTISNSNIAKTDKLLAFNNNDSKAATIQDVVQLVPGKMAVATCSTAGNVATKAVTCDDWNNKPGQSILVEFSNANSADNVTLSINSGTAIPVYYMNTATEQVSGGAIPAGAVVFTLNAAGNKFYAHVTKLIEGAGVKIDGSKIEAVNDLPTDAVLHYSFDDLPDYPDGANIYYKNRDWTIVDWDNFGGHGTITVENGILVNSGVNDYLAFQKSGISIGAGAICKLKLVSTIDANVLIYGFQNDYIYIKTINLSANTPLEDIFSIGFNTDILLLRTYSASTTLAELKLIAIYIGDGSYSTPVIDNANGQNNATNNGGIATKGVSGKGIQFLQNSNAYIYSNSKPLDGLNSWTISFWLNLNKGVKATSQNPRLYMFGSLEYCYIDDFYIGGSGTKADFITFKDSEHIIGVSMNMSQYIGKTIFVTVETEIDTESTSTKRVYVNGVLKSQGTGSIIEKPTYSSWSIGGTDGNLHLENSMIDDFQIFDRALTEKEVVALYNNKANTPKYFSKADYLLEQIANNS